jgi:hypothetical protein
MSEPHHIITLKWGTRYGPGYVNRLAASVGRNSNSPITINCFTDDPSGIDPSVQIHPIPEIDLLECPRKLIHML